MKRMTQEEYVMQLGERCPECGSEDIRATEQVESCSRAAYQNVTCNVCGADWTDEYKLIGYDHLTKGGKG